MAEFEEKLGEILGNQQAMGQIMALAQSLSGGGAPAGEGQSPPPPTKSGGEQTDAPAPQINLGDNPLSALGELDPRLIQLGMRLVHEYQGGDDRNTALLMALRPFLREERYAKLDRAIQIAKLSRVIRVAFETLGRKGEDGVV